MRKTKYSNEQKAEIALAAIKGQDTVSQIGSHYRVHPGQINRWKTKLLQAIPSIFSQDEKREKELAEKENKIEELYKIIGQREVELEWLKKKLKLSNS